MAANMPGTGEKSFPFQLKTANLNNSCRLTFVSLRLIWVIPEDFVHFCAKPIQEIEVRSTSKCDLGKTFGHDWSENSTIRHIF